MNTQHKVGCVDLGCPGCDATNPRPNPPTAAELQAMKASDIQNFARDLTDQQLGDRRMAGDPPSVTEPEECPKCHSTARRIVHKPCDNGSMTNPTKKAHPWHNAAQPEPREEETEAEELARGCTCICHKVGLLGFMCCPCSVAELDRLVNGNRTQPVSPPAVANTPQPDLEERQQFEAWWISDGHDKRSLDWISEEQNALGGVLRYNSARARLAARLAFTAWLAARRLSPDPPDDPNFDAWYERRKPSGNRGWLRACWEASRQNAVLGSPDRKLVEALRAIVALEPFHAYMEPSEYVRRVDNIAEAALKTQEPAPKEGK